jgi:asparagine synthase (glutamine-hydrolysing)
LDKVGRRAVIVRDPAGITTIVYSTAFGGLAVGDSAASLRQVGLPVRPDYIAGAEFVMTHYRYHRARPSRTLFEGVSGLAPGELLEWPNDSQLHPQRYWTPDASRQYLGTPDWFDHYRTVLSEGIDVAVAGLERPAFALSSGMDSGTVASLATKMYGPVKLITTRFDLETLHDESADVRPTAEALGGEWIQVTIKPDDVRSAFGEVGGDFSDWPASTVTQVLHRVLLERLNDLDIDGLISGLGGDEVNCGEIEEYLYYFADLTVSGERQRLQDEMPGWIQLHGTADYPKSREVLDDFLASQVDLNVPGRILPNYERYWHYADCLALDVRDQLGFTPLPEPFDSYLLNKLFQDLLYETIPPVLDLEQWNARHTGVGTYYPFLRQEMIDIGFSTDPMTRYNQGVSKAALRSATIGLVPDSARLNHYKRGWNAPLDVWLRDSMGDEVRELVASDRLRDRGTYNLDRVSALLEEHLSGARNHMLFLWQFIAYEKWLGHLES